jgi:hypothetical protein
MGIDLLNLKFHIEREFHIRIGQDEMNELIAQGKRPDPPPGYFSDIRVRDFTGMVERIVAVQNPAYNGHVVLEVQRQIASTLGVEEWDVTPGAWLVRDLGMN